MKKIFDYKIGNLVYQFVNEDWQVYGKIILDEGIHVGLKLEKHDGICMMRKEDLYSQGFISLVAE